jgi:hypothetical protein
VDQRFLVGFMFEFVPLTERPRKGQAKALYAGTEEVSPVLDVSGHRIIPYALRHW